MRGLEMRGRLSQGYSDNVRRVDRYYNDVDASTFSEASTAAGFSYDLGFAQIELRAEGRYRAVWIDSDADTYESKATAYLRRETSAQRMFGIGIEFEGGYERQRYYDIFPLLTRQDNLRRAFVGGHADTSLRVRFAEFSIGAFGRYDDFSEGPWRAFFDNWWSTGRDGPGKPRGSFDNWRAGGECSVMLQSEAFSVQFWSRMTWKRYREQFELAADPLYARKGRLQFFEYTAGITFRYHYKQYVEIETGAYYRHVEGGRRRDLNSSATRYRHSDIVGVPVYPWLGISDPGFYAGIPFVRVNVAYDRIEVSLGMEGWDRYFPDLTSKANASLEDSEYSTYVHVYAEARLKVVSHLKLGLGFNYEDRGSLIPNCGYLFHEFTFFVEFIW